MLRSDFQLSNENTKDSIKGFKAVIKFIGNVFKVIAYVVASVVMIAVRLFFRSIKSIFFGLFNVFAGTKNFITITAKGQGWWRWLIFIIKLPIVLGFNIVKWILTSTLGTLYNLLESIFMVVKYWIESSKGNGKVEVRKLYELNFVENSFQDKTAGIDVLKGFMFADIDINNPLTGSASETKNKEFIKIVKDVFVSIGDAFLLFGTGGTNKNNKSQYISACNIYLADTLGISIDKTSLFYRPYEKSIDIQSRSSNLVNGNNGMPSAMLNNNSNEISNTDLKSRTNIKNVKNQNIDIKERIPLSSTFGPWEIL